MPEPYDYPIMGLDRFGGFHRFDAPEDFYSCDDRSLKQGLWVGMRLLDSSGVGREIVGVTPQGIIGGWYGRLLHRFRVNVFHWVLLDIAEEAEITLDEVKARLLADFEAEMVPRIEAEIADGVEGAQWLREAMMSATSVREIDENLSRRLDELEAREVARTRRRVGRFGRRSAP